MTTVIAAAQRIAKMDPWYQDPDDGWVCVFCGSQPIAGDKHHADCMWVELIAAIEQESNEYQRPETTEECEREMRRLSNGERGCQDPQAHERADRISRIAAVYPEAAREAREA